VAGSASPGAGSVPLVLLHGMSSGAFAWAPVLDLLGAGPRRVLALTYAGHVGGASILNDRKFALEHVVDDVEHQLDALGIDQADLVGNSLGGWIALRLAARGRARSVVCLAPAGGWRPGGSFDRWLRLQFTIGFYAARALLGLRAERLLRLRAVRRWFLAGMVSRVDNLDAEAATRAVSAVAGCDALRFLLRHPRSADLLGPGEVLCPVLVAWSAGDRILVSRKGTREFMRWVPGAEETTLLGVGHVPMSDDPELVAATVLEFVERLEAELEAPVRSA
jgi:pimeloyl-ACP methyl ester carboxylesterase